jgi:alkanesulfonate monooxygenase SsuD/methylene tetrahydromethanopterin reductase-like flavin-dependent oxidoreductase (luciferase family)
MAAAAKTASELSEGRFILGIGANNPVSMANRGLEYGKPVTYMRDYLAKMKAAAYQARAPRHEAPPRRRDLRLG